MRKITIALAAAAAMGATDAPAQVPDNYKWVVVFNTTSTAKAGTEVVSMPAKDFVKCVGWAANQDAKARLDTLQSEAAKKCLQVKSRWISSAGDSVLAVAFSDPGTTPKISFEELVRTSRLQTDLETLISIGAKLAGIAAVGPQTVMVQKSYVLTKTRATLKASVAVKKPAAAAGAAADEEDTGGKASIITGPTERLFLSANVGLTDAKQVSYDDENKALSLADTPSQFYIAANIAVADLYADHHANPFIRMFQSAYGGFFVEGSTRPLDQVGLIAGLHYIPLFSDFIGTDKISPFGGMLWVKNDALPTAADPNTIAKSYSSAKWIVGASLSLSESLSWLEKNAKKK